MKAVRFLVCHILSSGPSNALAIWKLEIYIGMILIVQLPTSLLITVFDGAMTDSMQPRKPLCLRLCRS